MNITHNQPSLTLEAAHRLAAIGQNCSDEMGFKMIVVVSDSLGNPLVLLRNPAAPIGALEFAERKAYTAASYGWPSGQWSDILEGRPVVAQSLSQHPKLCFVGGGIPVKVDGQVVGAIGVAGAKAPEDHAVAQAALERFFAEMG